VLSIWLVEPLGAWLVLGQYRFDAVPLVLIAPLCVAGWLGAQRQARVTLPTAHP
jgi:hypothetical protein